MIYGFGINNATYKVCIGARNDRIFCPFYERWREMIRRCYAKTNKYPTYRDCSVHPDWKYFMNFRSWMMFQDWQGKQLDKDILYPGNKIYSPDTCCFVSGELNLLVGDKGSAKGRFGSGVFQCRKTGKYLARCKVRQENHKHIGTFSTPEEANQAYRSYKAEQILKISREGLPTDIAAGLMRHAAALLN
ncbi:AP2 domain-containing protein [Curvivirga aplysinae]|uniref:AP2 domain-containing protein n=1 Tax=Curvivirga aplysinae TaxID=2529852 RepID=UPI0012BD74C6|nr:AP2 domain-containing protein [Curvivirga aplysinae]MTI10509.1 hypothetical protein [Curvivirga aplysinae]